MRFSLTPILLAATLSATGWAADSAPTPKFADPERRAKLAKAMPEIDRIFGDFRDQRGIPGLVYGIVADGELIHVKALGVRERKSGDAVTPGTVFRIASMTKSFTAVAILKLRDEGKLSLEDPVSKWVPEFARMPMPTGDSAVIRIRDLMTHGAGFPEDNPWGDRQLAVPDARMTEWLKAGLPFSTSPSTAWEYSNYGFALLGRIVEKASRQSYRSYVEKKILAPLGMTSTSLEPTALPANRSAVGYRKIDDVYTEEPSLAHGSFGAMGGMATTANDLAKYVAFHLSAWPARDGDDRGPVRRASLREMQQLQRAGVFRVSKAASPQRVTTGGYGFGLMVQHDCRYEHLVGHGGGLPGFGSYMMWLPEYGVGVIAMANLTYSGPSQPSYAAIEAMYKTGGLKPRTLPAAPVLTSMRDVVARIWNKWDEAALTAVAADNLYLDSSAAMRRQEMEKLKAKVGACQAPGDVAAINWLRGTFYMPCEKGGVEVFMTMAPTNPPKLQMLRFTSYAEKPKPVDGFCPAN